MEPYTITAELNLKKLIAESREVAKAFDEFADEIEKIEKKYTKSKKNTSNNGFPHFMTELTEDDLDESEGKE